MKELFKRLEKIGVNRPKVMSVSALTAYPDIYFKRECSGALTGLEPDFNHFQGLQSYILPWKYIVGMALPYDLMPKDKSYMPKELSSISIMAWEWDYHEKIRAGLRAVLGTDSHYEVHIDQGPLPERYLAMQMGIAEPGRSQMLIHPEYGTAFHLAFILTNLEVTEGIDIVETFPGKAFKLAEFCSNCKACQVSCPSGALLGEADFEPSRCISAITQKKGMLSSAEMDLLGRQLYGCDLCQLSCPANMPLSTLKKSFLPQRETMNRIDPEMLLACSQKTFKAQFGQMGFPWRGLSVSKRNALINIGNYGFLDQLAILDEFMQSQRGSEDEVLYQTCVWAKEKLIKRQIVVE